ncbi:MAG: hypothetical protein JF613_00090 [Acidobacteria bacterium]|jgi:hypothetical protein|nr:hypothetical protein [Acidobacteriota bacterium]
MEQRRLRLGDILDDYCPRERRLTNHAIVAMIEEDIKQTRCTTCDAEHAYKGGKLPKRRKKETTAALYKEVLAGQGNPESPQLAVDPDAEPIDEPVTVEDEAPAIPSATADASAASIDHDDPESPAEEPNDPQPDVEEGPVHRPLIRAQLPRIEGQKEERRLPEFTIRQRGGNGHFRGDSRMKQNRHAGNGPAGNGANGNRTHGGPRFAGPRPAGGSGRGPQGRGGGQPGFRSGQRQGGGRKRSR